MSFSYRRLRGDALCIVMLANNAATETENYAQFNCQAKLAVWKNTKQQGLALELISGILARELPPQIAWTPSVTDPVAAGRQVQCVISPCRHHSRL